MSRSLRKSALVLCLSVGILSHTAHAGSEWSGLKLGGAFGVSVTVFIASVVGILYSVQPYSGALFEWKSETTCYEKQVVCLDGYLCSPSNADPCYKVVWINSSHFANATSDCKINHAFCVAPREPVTPQTVSSPVHEIWLGKNWAPYVFGVSCIFGVISLSLAVITGGNTIVFVEEWIHEDIDDVTPHAQREDVYLTMPSDYSH